MESSRFVSRVKENCSQAFYDHIQNDARNIKRHLYLVMGIKLVIDQTKYNVKGNTEYYCKSIVIRCSLSVKVDMKRKFLFSHMKVHEKQERTLLTVFWYLIWFQRYLRLKGRNMSLKYGSLQTTTTVKIMTSSGLHVDHWVIRLTITR